MNADTGHIYYGVEQIEAAEARGERLIDLSPTIAEELGLPRVSHPPLFSALGGRVVDSAAEAEARAARRAREFVRRVNARR